ncbi:MAG: F0F1 ATP synthase subunit epsilon [Candidatus Marinimicrobia bacterium]|nr:F0F1 ATP synthase subunit epsilon [Candidatus Neomarinimicrobiota bacterium]MCF7829898.1 F0F1 ATP synthase subunit epsilon [Candidatus Neomarinimicrobiota bacterium]MCF7879139.1 F0F1 ATP synthase subunit epsilon [Candidatus Neomarinimicrobiota bacterium]
MPEHLSVEIVTPTSLETEEQVDYVRAPGLDGLFGVKPGHIPALIALDVGEVGLDKRGERRYLATSGGYAEIHNEKVVLLVETAEDADDIDVERAKAAKQRAEERLAAKEKEGIDTSRAKDALRRAKNRLTVANRA